jgi:hypothetical protein
MGRWRFSDLAEMRLPWAQVDWHMSPVLLSMHELHIYETQVSTAPVQHDYQSGTYEDFRAHRCRCTWQ